MKSPWLVPFGSRGAQPQHRLFCFPYAGGSAHVFRAWPPLLPSNVEVVAIQAPGKGSRMVETPLSRVEDVVSGVLGAISTQLRDLPFSFFGHSNGALIAFELASELQDRGLPTPERLYLSASPAPWTRHHEREYASMSDDEFVEKLRHLNGTPPGVFDEPELLDLILPGLRADFVLGERYRRTRQTLLKTPTVVFAGDDDEIQPMQVRGWQDAIADELEVVPMPGGHFFLHTHLDHLAAALSAQLTRDMGMRAGMAA